MDAAVRCMLDTVERFNQKVPSRSLNYDNANVKVNVFICDIILIKPANLLNGSQERLLG